MPDLENVETELNESDLFNDAVADEPASLPEPQPEPEPQGEPEAQLTPEGDKPEVDDNAPMVPSWRVREINEEKRTLAERVKALEAERLQPRPEPPKPAEKPAKPDPLLDPEGYATSIREELRMEALNDRREESLQSAREANPQAFDEAYVASMQAIRNGDVAIKARMQASRNPGKTLLEWFGEQKTRQEIGGDLNAYKQRLRDEALKDPEFRKAAMEAWRSDAQPQSNGRPRVELPPSLSGASRANSALKSANNDVDDRELFNLTTDG